MLTISTANATDNSGDTGWNAAYATEQAVINGTLGVYHGYFEINGVTGSGTAGHGIRINDTVGATHTITFSNDAGPYHVHNVEIEGPGYAYGSLAIDGINYNSIVENSKGFHVSYCYIHEIPRNAITTGLTVGTDWTDPGMTIENNFIERTGGVGIAYPAVHGQPIQVAFNTVDKYTIFRNNTFKNCRGSAAIAFLGGASADHSYSRIYNNLFYFTITSGTYIHLLRITELI